MNLEIARNQMLGQQIRTWEVLNPRVLEALGGVPRENFVPPRYARLAFADTHIPLAHGELMMAPLVEGRMLQTLQIERDDAVLEIGTGSGFVTACLSRLGGHVRSMEIHQDLSDAAGAQLRELGCTNVTLEVADAYTLREEGSYDVIAITGSLAQLDDRFRLAMKVGGRLFAIVGQAPVMEARLVERIAADQWRERSLFETSLPSLHNATPLNLFDW